jgi:nucleoside 2-deoxyribosyltransferase
MERYRVYCSGPLFCAEEIGGMSAIAKVLEDAGFQTFLPHRDGMEGYVLRFSNSSFPSTVSGIRTRIDYAIFSLDVYELIERCSAVVCNLNGRVPDEGMIVEAALAYAVGKPLVLFKDDRRAPFGGYDNSMLTSLVRGIIVDKIKDLPVALMTMISQKADSVSPSSDLKKAISNGKRISSILESLPEKMFKKKWSDEVICQVIDESLTNE